eukprot:COSAG01_NODE_2075_length_8488_cov_3.845274_9_plen_70_part_00
MLPSRVVSVSSMDCNICLAPLNLPSPPLPRSLALARSPPSTSGLSLARWHPLQASLGLAVPQPRTIIKK